LDKPKATLACSLYAVAHKGDKKKMNKTGQLNMMGLVGLAIAFVIFGVATSTGAVVVSKVEGNLDDKTTSNVAYNATQNANKGIEELTGWSETIATVSAAAVILGILTMFGVVLR